MRSLVFLLSIFLFTTGCQPKSSEVKPLYLAGVEELSPGFQEKIVDAIKMINQEAPREIISLQQKPGYRPLIILQMGPVDLYAHATYHDHHCRIEIDENNTVVNNNDPDLLDLRYVILHETGHCYGYGHSKDATHVMYETYLGSQAFFNRSVVESRILAFLNSFF